MSINTDDISAGQEPHAVPLVGCSLAHVTALESVFQSYIIDNQLSDGTLLTGLAWPAADESEGGEDSDEESPLWLCECREDELCIPGSECECVSHFGNFYTQSAGLGLQYLNLTALPPNLPLVECGLACQCVLACQNRVTQRGVSDRLELRAIGPDLDLGLGLFTKTEMRAGHFVCLYAGEWIDTETARRRWATRVTRADFATLESRSANPSDEEVSACEESSVSLEDGKKRKAYLPSSLQSSKRCKKGAVKTGNYVLSVRENGETLGHIDPTEHGNIGRFINHSCEPNLVLQTVRWGPGSYPRIAVFARRDINAGDELRYDYADASCTATVARSRGHQEPISETASDDWVHRTKCKCGAATCRGWIPFDASL